MVNLLEIIFNHQLELLEGNTANFDEEISDLDINLYEVDVDQIWELFGNASLYAKIALQSSLYDAHLKKFTDLGDRVLEYQKLKTKVSFL